MKRHYFEFILAGVGDTPEQALEDALDSFQADPGEPLKTWDEPLDEDEEVPDNET